MNIKTEPFEDGLGVTRWRVCAVVDSAAKAAAAAAALQELPAESAFVPNPDPFAASAVADDPPERATAERTPVVEPFPFGNYDPEREDDTGEPYAIPGCATGACGMD